MKKLEERIMELLGDPADYADFVDSVKDLPQLLGDGSTADCEKTAELLSYIPALLAEIEDRRSARLNQALDLLDKFQGVSLQATVTTLRNGGEITERIQECIKEYRDLVKSWSESA